MSIFSRAAIAANVLWGTCFRAVKLSVRSQSNRTLYPVNKVLKIGDFEERRKIAKEKVKSEKDHLVMQIVQELETGQSVNTRNVKELLFFAEREDLDLVVAAMKNVESHSPSIRLSAFNTEATLMRLFYYLNAAELACAVFLDPAFKKTYIGYTSVLILLQLLYKNNMYSEIIDCVEHLEAKQCWNVWSASLVGTLFMVSCLQLNTPEAHRKVVLYFEKYVDFRFPKRGCALVAAYCAACVEHSKVDFCLKFVPVLPTTVELRFNILLQVLLKEGKLIPALDLLEDCTNTLTQDTVDLIFAAVGGQGEADLKSFITDHVKVCKETLVDCLIDYCFEGGVDDEEQVEAENKQADGK